MGPAAQSTASNSSTKHTASDQTKSSVVLTTNPKCPFMLADVVWARLTSRSVWWPAIVIDPKMCGYELNDRIWVLWFGDQRVSDVELSHVKYIFDDFNVCYRCRGSPRYHNSVQIALELFFDQFGLVCPRQPITEALLGWSPGFKEEINSAIERNTDKKLPGYVTERLEEILRQGDNIVLDFEDDDDDDEEDEFDDTARKRSSGRQKSSNSDLNHVSTRRYVDVAAVNAQCLVCSSSNNGLVDHPFFMGKLCEACQKRFKEVYFVIDEDGKKEFCSLCACTGSMVICDDAECSNVFCKQCIVSYGSAELHESILEMDPWRCFLCTGDCLGALGSRKDWKKFLFALFNASSNVKDEIDLQLFPKERRPIRVLSLFDGLATGKVILDLLQLQIDTYYCCEIDPDALLVSRINHPKNVIFLGDVRQLTLAKLEEISPIDLLIGGSPCNDTIRTAGPVSNHHCSVDISDPEGTGILFFEYYRVLQSMLLINTKQRRNLFWLFENVASMRDCYKSVIDRFLGRPPALYDSRFFSAQNRARYFWGNIPGMYQACCAVDENRAPVLDDILTPNCGRKSKMAKVRTITTRSNSLKQGRSFSLCPVEMDGRPDTLWPTEIEKLFGFPQHYTDVGGLPPTKRQKLIGQGWTIPVVRHIMRPLQKFFKRTE